MNDTWQCCVCACMHILYVCITIVIFSMMAVLICIPIVVYWGTFSLHYLYYLSFTDNCRSNRCEVISHGGFNLPVKYFYHMPIGYLHVFFEKCLFRSYAFFFCYWVVSHTFCVPIFPKLNICRYFPLFSRLLLHADVSFVLQKLLEFIVIHYVFSFCLFCVCF